LTRAAGGVACGSTVDPVPGIRCPAPERLGGRVCILPTPTLHAPCRGSAVSRVFVLCPDYDPPSGGVRKLYRHVDVLRAHGVEAWLVHTRDGFRCSWFPNATPVAYAADVRPTPRDYVVVPEVYGPELARLYPGVPKVVFNQNAYFTFRGYTLDPADLRTPYTSPEVVAALVVSEDNREYLGHAFPGLRLVRVRYGIDTGLFTPRGPKERAVAFMPRKHAEDAVQVVNLLKHRGALAGWRVVPVDGMPEPEVAGVLARCAVFLSFGQQEGGPLPPLEAMACGCVVVGYHGRSGREYFREEFSRPVEAGDVVGFAQAAEGVLRAFDADPVGVRVMGERAAAYVRDHYSPEREAMSILAAWEFIRLPGRSISVSSVM